MKKLVVLCMCGFLAAGSLSVQAEEAVTIRVLKAESSQQESWDKLAALYTETVAPNVTVEIESYDDEYPTVLATRINAGEIPDIFVSVPYTGFSKYIEYAYDLTGQPMLDFVSANAQKGVTSDGKIMGMAFYGDAQGIIYNKAMFADAGIEEMPKTLSELRTACEKLTEAGYTPFFNCYGSSWVVADILSPFFALSGDYAELAAGLDSGEMTFAETGKLPQIFDLIDLTVEYGNDAIDATFQDQYNAFAFEECAMILQGNWYENSFNKLFDEGEDPFEIGMFPIPVSEDPAESLLTTSEAWGYMVAKDSEHIEEAIAFLEWIVSTEDGQSIISSIGKLPFVKGMEVATQLNTAATEYINAGAITNKARSLWPDGFEAAMIETVQAYILGDLTREEAYAEFQADWAELYQ